MIEKIEINPIDTYVGKKVRERRQKLGWTLMELAQKLGVSHQQIQKYEQGTTRVSAGALYQLSRIFQTNQNYFFDGFSTTPAPESDGVIHLEPLQELNIIVIEDDAADELLTRKALKECDFIANVHALHDGEEAIQFLRHCHEQIQFPRPDLILLDLNMPKRDGHMVLKEIKRDRNIQDIPVIILTNSVNRQEMISAYKNGASGYLCKSFDFNLFKQHINNIMHYWGGTVALPSRH